jgi:hypothetical protein
MPLYMILCRGALSKENVVFLPRLTNSMEQKPSSEISSRSTTESFDSVHKGQAIVPVLSKMVSGNFATSYSTRVHKRS